MKAEIFSDIAGMILENAQKVLVEKANEYSRNGDRLWNFNEVARINKKRPIDILMCMKAKHEQSIRDIIEDTKDMKYPTNEMLMEKFGDNINYLILAVAVIMEERDK